MGFQRVGHDRDNGFTSPFYGRPKIKQITKAILASSAQMKTRQCDVTKQGWKGEVEDERQASYYVEGLWGLPEYRTHTLSSRSQDQRKGENCSSQRRQFLLGRKRAGHRRCHSESQFLSHPGALKQDVWARLGRETLIS